jgi:hypothetical protein
MAPNNVRDIKLRIRWWGHVTYMKEMRAEYKESL